MSAWLSKWAPASGTLAGVLVAIAFFASPNSPGDNATGAQVIAWYNSHHTADFVFDLIGGLAVLFLVFFAVALARQVRTGDRWLAYGALGFFGGVVRTFWQVPGVIATAVVTRSGSDLLASWRLILPKWMGWVMFVFGLACLAGPAGFFGVLAVMLWVLVAGIWMVKQGPPVPDGATVRAEDRVAV